MSNFQKNSKDYGEPDITYQLAGCAEQRPLGIPMAWMLRKRPYIVPIPGTRKESRLRENAAASDVTLTDTEFAEIDKALSSIPMSDVFGGSRMTK